ncbi:hypothetical protein VLK31_09415 [Variovorax sp. H27-G14]|uniref:hypothetical protein n=1 Tax=Variovorax sp. H27-G14 TaxID=3111914 RepID=UPI0038FC5E53
MKKIRLNDEQWTKLLALPVMPIRTRENGATPDAPRTSSRMSSHGLVAADADGREYITDQGVHRLSQGR